MLHQKEESALWTKLVEALWHTYDKHPKATRRVTLIRPSSSKTSAWGSTELCVLPRFVRRSESVWFSELSFLKLYASSQGTCLFVSNISILSCCEFCRETQYSSHVRRSWVLLWQTFLNKRFGSVTSFAQWNRRTAECQGAHYTFENSFLDYVYSVPTVLTVV